MNKAHNPAHPISSGFNRLQDRFTHAFLHGGGGTDEADEYQENAEQLAPVERAGDTKAAEGTAEGGSQGADRDEDVADGAVQQDTFAPEDPG